MKRETVYSITELLVILIDHVIAYPTAVVLMELLKSTGVKGMSSWAFMLIVWIILYAIYVCGFFVNKYIRKIDGQGRTKRALNPAVAAIVLMISMLLSKETSLQWWPGFVQFILVCGLYVVFLYMCHFQEFLMVSDASIGKSATKRVLKNGVITIVIFACIMMLILTAVVCIPTVRELLDAFVEWLRGAIFIRAGNVEVEDLSIFPQEALVADPNDLQIRETPIWLVAIEMFASAVLLVFVVMSIIAMIRLLIDSIMDAIRASRPSHMELDDRIIDDVTDEVENLLVKERRSLRDVVGDIRLSPAQKIRRLYKKYVVANRDFLEKGLGGTSVEKATAREVVAVGTVSDDVINLYERARYSNAEVVADDYKKMKQFMK